MSLFPQRTSLDDFLKMYEKLPSDGEDDDYDDLGEESDDDDESDDGADVAGLLASDNMTAAEVAQEEEKHKELDAALRDEEERKLEALAARFEAKAADYERDEREPSLHKPAPTAKRLQEATRARAVREEAEWLHAQEQEAAKAAAEQAEKLAVKREALYALFDGVEPQALASAAPAPTETKKRPTDAAETKGRFRISKKKAKTEAPRV